MSCKPARWHIDFPEAVVQALVARPEAKYLYEGHMKAYMTDWRTVLQR